MEFAYNISSGQSRLVCHACQCESVVQKLQLTAKYWRWQDIQRSFCPEPEPINQLKVQNMNKSSLKNFQPEQQPFSEQKDDYYSFSPAIANTNVGRSCSPLVRLYQYVSRNMQFVMQLAYHVQRKLSLSVQYFTGPAL